MQGDPFHFLSNVLNSEIFSIVLIPLLILLPSCNVVTSEDMLVSVLIGTILRIFLYSLKTTIRLLTFSKALQVLFDSWSARFLKKILHFVWKRHISWIIKNPPGDNFASGAVWHTIAFKVSAFYFFCPKMTDVPICSTFLSSTYRCC